MYRSRKNKRSSRDPDERLFIKEINLSTSDDVEASLSTTMTGEMMDICKIKIIGPFNIMLTMVGWRSLTTQFPCHEKCPMFIRCIDKVILLLFISLLLFSYVYQVMACRFEININDKIVTTTSKIPTKSPIENISTARYLEQSAQPVQGNETLMYESYVLCNHISTTFIIPDLLHIIAYIIGLIHYRYNENEDIYGLMEKTLQYTTTMGVKKKQYYLVTRMLSIWMCMAVVWVLMAIVNHILYDVTYNTFTHQVYIFSMNPNDSTYVKYIKHCMFVLDFLGYIISSVVTVVIVFNYTIYCELVKFYIDAISKKIEVRCIKLNTVKNDMQNVSGTICLINGVIGKMMTLILIMLINILLVGLNDLFVPGNESNLEIAFEFYFVILVIPLILISLIQCVRVNLALKSFKKLGRHMNVFGYRKESRKQLDSFLLFTMAYNSKAKIMAIPMEWWQLMVFFLLLGFSFITMIQIGVLDKVPVLNYL